MKPGPGASDLSWILLLSYSVLGIISFLGSPERYLKHFVPQTLLKIENDVSYVTHGM